jgi:hypothetical protein
MKFDLYDHLNPNLPGPYQCLRDTAWRIATGQFLIRELTYSQFRKVDNAGEFASFIKYRKETFASSMSDDDIWELIDALAYTIYEELSLMERYAKTSDNFEDSLDGLQL